MASSPIQTSATISSNVYVLDGSTNAIIATIPMPNTGSATSPLYQPIDGISVNTVTNRVYVGYSYEVQVVDGNTNTIVASFQRSHGRTAIDSTQNLIYGGNFLGDGVSVTNGSTNSIVKNISLNDDQASILTFNSPTNTVYAAVPGFPYFYEINATAGTYTSFSSTIYDVSSMVYDPGSNNLLLAESRTNNSSVNALGMLNPATQNISYVYLEQDNGTYGVDVNSSTHLAYVSTGSGAAVSGHLQVVDLNAKQVIADINTPGFSYTGTPYTNVGVNPTTNRIYCANGEAGTVSIIDGASNTVVDTISLP